MEQFEATIEGTVFRNPENGYSVITVRSGRSEHTVIGTLPELSPGEQVIFHGEWTEHRTYGRQFRCESCELQTPTTLLGIERYLGSGLIHGVGPSTASLIVEAFGEDTLTILSEHPERLSEVRGIGKKRAAMIAESFLEQQGARRAMVFLQSYGVSPALAVRISRYYGDRTPEIIREDPYRLCDDIEGVGFNRLLRDGRGGLGGLADFPGGGCGRLGGCFPGHVDSSLFACDARVVRGFENGALGLEGRGSLGKRAARCKRFFRRVASGAPFC